MSKKDNIQMGARVPPALVDKIRGYAIAAGSKYMMGEVVEAACTYVFSLTKQEQIDIFKETLGSKDAMEMMERLMPGEVSGPKHEPSLADGIAPVLKALKTNPELWESPDVKVLMDEMMRRFEVNPIRKLPTQETAFGKPDFNPGRTNRKAAKKNPNKDQT